MSEIDDELNLYSTEADETSEVVKDNEAIKELTDLLDDSNLDATDSGILKYKGSMVKADMRDQMVHIVDKIKSHFGKDTAPDVNFSILPLT